jgi:hypothetical protein
MLEKGIKGQIIDFAHRLFVINRHRNDAENIHGMIDTIMGYADQINKFVIIEPRDKTPRLEALDSALGIFEMYSNRVGPSATFREVNAAFLVETAGKMLGFIEGR